MEEDFLHINIDILLLLICAITPAIVLLRYIANKDELRPKPTIMLVKAFVYGIISAVIALCVVLPIMYLDIALFRQSAISGAFAYAFFMAAIPEETAKLLMLWLLLRRSAHYNERYDGIVYAVCIGMGFAASENVLYLFCNYGSWFPVSIARAVFAIPCHFISAVIMGYYYSLWHFKIKPDKEMVLVGPILAHGIYDGMLLSIGVGESISGLLLVLFVVLLCKLKEKVSSHIEEFEDE